MLAWCTIRLLIKEGLFTRSTAVFQELVLLRRGFLRRNSKNSAASTILESKWRGIHGARALCYTAAFVDGDAGGKIGRVLRDEEEVTAGTVI